ncbi:MAG: alkaline phosphatase D family protein, partial [Polyangiaceae bacterium]
ALQLATWSALSGCRNRQVAPSGALSECGAPAGPAAGDVKIAFGSCNQVHFAQPLWESILSLRSDMWVWLGDSVYADTEDIAKTRALYDAQRAKPDYAKLMRSTRIVGTWDDHDYGINDGGREYPSRVESQQAFLDFVDEPRESARRKQEGLYTSYTVGEGEHSAKVILLDERYHRDQPGPEGDMLGDAQWAWLENELRHSSSDVHLIGSSTQIVAEEHPFEKWSNFPRARTRLFELFAKTAVSGVIVLSGDRHMAEIARIEAAPLRYPLWEITSSGLTHSWKKGTTEPNRHRIGDVLAALNYGLIEIDWANGGEVRLAVIDLSSQRRLHQRIPLSSLKPA